jgi:hypothetical protein
MSDFIDLFICGLFNNIVSSWDKKVSNDEMINKYHIEEDMNGSSHSLI